VLIGILLLVLLLVRRFRPVVRLPVCRTLGDRAPHRLKRVLECLRQSGLVRLHIVPGQQLAGGAEHELVAPEELDRQNNVFQRGRRFRALRAHVRLHTPRQAVLGLALHKFLGLGLGHFRKPEIHHAPNIGVGQL
jgi:hypothetical protein